MTRVLIASVMAGSFCTGAAAHAAEVLDVDYLPNAIVAVEAQEGFAVHIALNPAEHIQSVAVGDARHWLVVAKDGAHDVFLKPKEDARPTNLLLRTDSRSYSFLLRTVKANPTYRIVFHYPQTPAPPSTIEPKINRHYSMQVGRGSQNIVPIAAYDDDNDLYLAFAPHAEIPAVFEVLNDKTERIVNYHVMDGVLVIHGVFAHIALRLGTSVVSVFRDTQDAAPAPPPAVVIERATRKDITVPDAP